MADLYRPDPRPGGQGTDSIPLGPDSQENAEQIQSDFYDAAYDQTNASSNDYQSLDVDVEAEKEIIDEILNGTGADVSLSEFMSKNPGLTPDDYYLYMSQHSDEWAEKYLDYLTEKQSLEEQNKYSAEREDTAYQRLVEDLKKAGLNPAMMYGSSASPSASNSLGYLRQSEGANSRSVGNFNKLKTLLISIMAYELYRKLDTVGQITTSGKQITGMFKDLVGISSALFG